MWLNLTLSFKTGQLIKLTLKGAMGLTWLQPLYSFLVTGHARHHDGEHIKTGNGNHFCMVIQLCTAIAVLCLCCDFSILLYHSTKSKSYAMTIISNK